MASKNEPPSGGTLRAGMTSSEAFAAFKARTGVDGRTDEACQTAVVLTHTTLVLRMTADLGNRAEAMLVGADKEDVPEQQLVPAGGDPNELDTTCLPPHLITLYAGNLGQLLVARKAMDAAILHLQAVVLTRNLLRQIGLVAPEEQAGRRGDAVAQAFADHLVNVWERMAGRPALQGPDIVLLAHAWQLSRIPETGDYVRAWRDRLNRARSKHPFAGVMKARQALTSKT